MAGIRTSVLLTSILLIVDVTVRVSFLNNHRFSSRGFRHDIQGLRAFAVIAVVLFHADLGMHGGFIGVDVFFVISGFVITTVLLREQERNGRVRWRHFFVRRIKRLGPALAVVTVFTGLASLLLLSPLGPQQNAINTGIGATLLAANAVILAISGGYFDQPAETNPLLNTWSLSVEEQFYIGFPLIWLTATIVMRNKAFTTRLGLIVTFMVVASFTLMMLWRAGLQFPGADSLLGFYGPLSRTWEFGVGALIATVPRRLIEGVPNRASNFLSALALGIVVVSVAAIGEEIPWPSLWTSLPVLATGVLLALGGNQSGLVDRALSMKWVAAIGDRSYSIYLWHWPLIVFASALWPTSTIAKPLAIILSLIPALLSFRYVEQPIRSRDITEVKPTVNLVIGVTVIPLIVLLGARHITESYLEPRLRGGQVEAYYSGDLGGKPYRDRLNMYFECASDFIEIIAVDSRLTCHQSRPNQPVDIAILGDSHALRLFPGVAANAPTKTVGYFSHGGLPPERSASETMARIIDYVVSIDSAETVIISAWWNLYSLDEAGLRDTINRLTARGKTVFLFDDVPDFTFDAFRCKYGVGGLVRMKPVCEEISTRNDALREIYFPILTDVAASSKNVHLVSIYDYFCDSNVCRMSREENILYQDRHHLNFNGSEYVIKSSLEDYPAFSEALR